MWTFNSEICPERKLKCEESYGVYGSHKNVLYLYLLGFVLMAIFYGLDHGKWPFLTNIWENISGTFSRHRTSKSKMVATTKTVQKHEWEPQRFLPLHGSCVCAFWRVPTPCQEVGNCSVYDFQQGCEDHVLKHQQKICNTPSFSTMKVLQKIVNLSGKVLQTFPRLTFFC